jgi:hypothetical protein
VDGLNGRQCGACGRDLQGRATKWCADLECKRERTYWAWVLRTYNLTPEAYRKIWDEQDGKCPITGKELDTGTGKRPHIDHDHVSGHVRGIVSAYANTRLIGRLRYWVTAQNLADYLKEPPATRALGGPVVAAGRTKPKRKKRRRA